MDFISEKKAERRIGLLILLLCLLPQLLRVALSCIYEYEVAGNYMYPTLVGDLCLYGADILGQFSFFSILGSLIYMSARNGLKGGGETALLVIGLYIALYYIQSALSITAFTLSVFVISAVMTALVIILSARKNKRAFALATAILTVPILGGIVQLYASSVIPSADDIVFLVSYALANVIFELLFILVACRTSSFLNDKMTGGISLTGKLVSAKNPVMLTMLVFDALYIVLSLIQPTVEIVQNLIEYGPPVNSSEWMSIIGVYVEYVIIFVIGYASMRFTAGLIENTYTRAEEE
ncbi:MAG: hypothetical protein IJY94_07005 [Clostridia bacterium]|nr:hypothetical protein [Clostridia bacterium]